MPFRNFRKIFLEETNSLITFIIVFQKNTEEKFDRVYLMQGKKHYLN